MCACVILCVQGIVTSAVACRVSLFGVVNGICGLINWPLSWNIPGYATLPVFESPRATTQKELLTTCNISQTDQAAPSPVASSLVLGSARDRGLGCLWGGYLGIMHETWFFTRSPWCLFAASAGTVGKLESP